MFVIIWLYDFSVQKPLNLQKCFNQFNFSDTLAFKVSQLNFVFAENRLEYITHLDLRMCEGAPPM